MRLLRIHKRSSIIAGHRVFKETSTKKLQAGRSIFAFREQPLALSGIQIFFDEALSPGFPGFQTISLSVDTGGFCERMFDETDQQQKKPSPVSSISLISAFFSVDQISSSLNPVFDLSNLLNQLIRIVSLREYMQSLTAHIRS